jgi:signal transduction histidine kinase
MYDGLRLYLIASGIIPYLIFNWSRPAVSLLCTIPTIMSLVFMDVIFSGMAGREVSGADFGLVPIRTWIAYAIISSGGLVLQYIIYRNDLFNEALVSELKAKNKELEASRQTLNSINLDLENAVLRKTHSLKVKNQALVKFAYANAHHIRGPLARILGLIQISKLNASTSIHDLFDKVKSESEAMDTIVKSISGELDNLSLDDEGEQEERRE